MTIIVLLSVGYFIGFSCGMYLTLLIQRAPNQHDTIEGSEYENLDQNKKTTI